MNKRVLKLTSLLIIGASIVFTACNKTEDKISSVATSTKAIVSKDVTVHFGYQPGHAQIVVARDLGYLDEEFKKDNITFELSKFTSGPPIIEAFAGKRLDIGQVGDQPAIQARANDIDIKAIGVYSSTEKANGLLALPSSNIKEIKDLKGKKVGVTIGSVSHQLLYIYLKSAGLKPTDIQQVNLAPGDIFTSLQSNNIDAAVTWEPYLSMAQASKSANLVTDGTGYKLNVNVIIASSDFLKQHPDIAIRLLKVFDKSEKWIKENTDKALDIISKDSGFKVEVLKPGFNGATYDLTLNEAAVKSIGETANFLKDNNIIKTQVDVKNLIDDSYLKSAGIQK